MQILIDAEINLPAGRIYDLKADDTHKEFFSQSLISALYGNGSMPKVADSWIDGASYISTAKSPCEFAVFMCDSYDSAIDTARILSQRLHAIRMAYGNIDNKQMTEKAKVVVKKNLVIFIVSLDTEFALDEILNKIS